MSLASRHHAGSGVASRNRFPIRKLLYGMIAIFVLCRGEGPAIAQSVVLNPNGVVDFDQLNYNGGSFGAEGDATIDVTNALALLPNGNLTGGYLNVVDSSGNWLVQNLPVLPSSVTGSDELSMRYSITGDSNGGQISSENLLAVLSTAPQTSAPSGTASSFTTTEVAFDAGGTGPTGDLTGYEPAAAPGIEGFNTNGVTGITYETGHPNVQAALNQCAPAAIANSLTWLKTTDGTPIPQPNTPGIGNVPGATNTLVGALDLATGRAVTSRTVGSGVWPLNGTLQYILSNNLQNSLSVSYASVVSNSGFSSFSGGPGSLYLNGTNNYTAYGLTATALGTNISYAVISNLLYKGYAVALDEAWGANGANGRHYIQVLGVGILMDQPYLIFSSGPLQTPGDPTDQYLGKFFPNVLNGTQAGFNSGIEVSWLNGNQLTSEGSVIDQLVAIQAVPEPTTLALVAVGGIAVMFRRRGARRKRRSLS